MLRKNYAGMFSIFKFQFKKLILSWERKGILKKMVMK